jgi:hypothetical protein
MNPTTPTYEDACSECNRPCSRVKRATRTRGQGFVSTRFVTSCCGAAPVAVPQETRT